MNSVKTEARVPELNDDERARLNAYAQATTPSPAEIEQALTRTLARAERVERRASFPDRRRQAMWVMAAGVATMIIATGALAGVRWFRAQSQPAPDGYGELRLESVDIDPPDEPGGFAASYTVPQQVLEPEPEPESSDSESFVVELASAKAAVAQPPRPRAHPREAAQPHQAPDDASQLADESRLLVRLRRALNSGDPASALDWAEEHARRHPRGALTEERLILEAVAACRDGQRARGRKSMGELRQRFPNTPALAKVEQACAGG